MRRVPHFARRGCAGRTFADGSLRECHSPGPPSRAQWRPHNRRPAPPDSPKMKDLTRGPITGHLVAMAIPMAVGMIFQTLYYFVDLYFVARLGDAAIAGVSAAGNAMFVILALTQVLGVGTVALISHAVGRKDQEDANLVFNQSLLIAALCGVFTLLAGYVLSRPYVGPIAARAAAV